MSSDWREYPFDEVIDFQEGPGILAKDFREDGVPLIRLAGLTKGTSLLEGCNYLDPELVERRYSHFRIRQGDILLSTSASLGRTAVVDEASEDAIVYTGIIRMRPMDNRLFAPYILYLLESSHFQNQVEAMGAGSVIRHFGPSHLRQMTVRVPSIRIQKRIAEILSALDEKIELNRQTNATLEAIAQAIFKEWFVHYNYPGATGNLVDSELGPIPAGWQEKPLFDFADYINGATYRNIDFSSDQSGLPVIKIAELKNGISDNTKFTTESLDSKYLLQTGDILFSWSGSPDTSIDVFIWDGGDAWLNQHIFNVIPNQGFNKTFLYFLLRNQMLIFIETARNKQTTGLGHVTQKDLKRLKFVAPPKNLRQQFHAVVGPIFDKLLENNLQNRMLIDIRDILLPKLMRGEIEV